MADTDQKAGSRATKLEREQLDEVAADPTKPLPDDLVPPLIYALNEGIRIRRAEERPKVREQRQPMEQTEKPDSADPSIPLTPDLVPFPEPDPRKVPEKKSDEN